MKVSVVRGGGLAGAVQTTIADSEALAPDDVVRACLFVATLPPRAHVPKLMLLPSRP